MRVLGLRFLFVLTLGCAATPVAVVPSGRNASGTAVPSARNAIVPAVPPERKAIGTAHPTRLLGAARDGAWVAICQARADTNHDGKIAFDIGLHGEIFGDALTAFLVLGSGPGKPIDRFLGNDPSGRWLVYAREGRRWLLDTKAGNEVALDAPARDGEAGVPRSGALGPAARSRPQFDSVGANLLYVTGEESHPRAVLRRLSDGHESDLDSGPGLLWMATFAPDGKYVVMQVVERDTDGDGVLRAPVSYTDRSSGPCGVAAVSFSGTKATDQPSWRVARVSDGSAQAVVNFEGTFGDAILRRTDSGSLVSEEGASTRELLPASCGARVLHADRADDTVVVACPREGNGLDVLHGGRRIHTGCKVDHVNGVSGLSQDSISPLTCADAPPGSSFGYLSFEKHGFRLITTGGRLFERPLVSEAGSHWRPDVHSPLVELCSSQPVLDLRSGELDQPNQRRVTLGTMGGLVLEAAGATSGGREALAIGPLFWAPPTDAGAHCASWEQMKRKR
jgi:hypothetical protein